MEPDSNSLYPIAVLIDELKSDELSKRVNAVKNLTSIAEALGYDRTRNELIPYLIELMDDEEEVLLALAENLGYMVENVGGKQHAHVLFEPLEELCQVEDNSVRFAAVSSFKKILKEVDKSRLENLTIDLLKRLHSAELFTSRITAANLIPNALEGISTDSQVEVIQQFRKLLQDSNPQVRKAASESLKSLTSILGEYFQSSLIEFLQTLAEDKEDSVRLLAVENIPIFLRLLPQAYGQLLSIVRTLLDDGSWRTRYLLADKTSEISKLLTREDRVNEICPFFVKFLQDDESEVRTAACTQLDHFSELISADDVSKNILPILAPLANDVNYVRAALASHINKLCPMVGKSQTNKHLMNLILSLLKDESAEIRMCLFNDLESINQVIGPESLAQGIMPAVSELSDDSNWRIRYQVAEIIPILSKQLGRKFFNDHLSVILKRLLVDPVYLVRVKTIEDLKELVELFGNEWLEKRLLDETLEDAQNDSYLRRLTTINIAQKLSEKVSSKALNNKIIDVLLNQVSDSVPNVRLNVAKAFKQIYSLVTDSGVKEQIRTALRVLNKDEDTDVRYFAEQAQRVCF